MSILPENPPGDQHIYIVHAMRWGLPTNHSYIVGCFGCCETAKLRASIEVNENIQYRCIVEEHQLNYHGLPVVNKIIYSVDRFIH